MDKNYSVAENIKGLSSSEAEKRLLENGYNELPTGKKRTFLNVVLEVVKEPMFLLLIAGGSIYLFLGLTEDPESINEALLLFSFVFVVIGITVYQERKVERALEALRDMSSPRALVIRDGEAKRIPGREVVLGDFIVLAEGDRVPADSLLVSSSNLLVDESLLTGESVPVRKTVIEGKTVMERPGGEDTPFVFSSTLVVQGHAVAEVKGVGLHTEIGKIGKALQSLEEEEESPLQKETGRLVKLFAFAGLAICLIVVLVYGLTRGNWIEGLLVGLTLAMALVPEEIPVVLTIFLALGAWRMSKHNVLTRRLKAIQTLGATTVLCVDKTGTLTLNRMTVRRLYAAGEFYTISDSIKELPESMHEISEFSILASQRDPFDPMEKAINDIGKKTLDGTEHLHETWELIQEYPLSKNLLALSHVWKSHKGDEYVIASKGAPEAIFDLCHLDDAKAKELEQKVQLMAGEGLRVLGVARAYFKEAGLPKDQHDFPFEFIGLIGLEDPIRPQVPQAVKECYEAGIRVIMITGDYPVTAQNIAKQIGLKSEEGYITGAQLEKLTDAELRNKIKNVCIFARVVPEQKLRIVEALKANKEIVVMTGDGVNDAPALKSAHIGIAMGGRGTEVAREASSLVLLDDDFSSIVQAVRMGRRIYENLKKAMAYIFAIHVPIAGMSLLPVLLEWPLALFPAHIAFLELIIDPVCSVVFEAEPAERNVMQHPPRKANEPLFDRKTIFLSVMQGIVALLIVAAVFRIAPMLGETESQARALAFTTLVFANLFLILANRSWNRTILETFRVPNKSLLWVFAGALFFLALALNIPFLEGVFQFGQITITEILICAAAGFASIAWFEIWKLAFKRK
jgi:Ca2+-transporting ATPase